MHDGDDKPEHPFGMITQCTTVQLFNSFDRLSRALPLREMASVLSSMNCASRIGLAELVRFNESLDQLLAKSVAQYSSQNNHASELFMGVLGHDLRTVSVSATNLGSFQPPMRRNRHGQWRTAVDRCVAQRPAARERVRSP